MQVKSLKHNFLMFFLRNFFNLGFMVLIFPLVAQKIGPTNLGKIQYVESIVAYFLLLINLGINSYGKREIAHNRENKDKISKITIELLMILFITTIFFGGIYICFVRFLVKDSILKNIMYIYFFNILLNFIGTEWFYEGIENQEYITKRNMFFKVISFILIFIFIKGQEDIYIYTSIIVFSLVGVNVLNFFNLKNYINFSFENLKIVNLTQHLKPMCILFFSALALSISYQLDSLMIRNIKSDIELGYYSFAMRFGKMPLIFTGAISAIFYPRLCNFLGNNNKKEYIKLLENGIGIIVIYSLPAALGTFLISDIIIEVFGGNQYLKAIPIMKIFAISILINSLAICTGSFTLIPQKKDKIYLLSIISGSALNFLFNIFFIKRLGGFGAAIATLITEIVAINIRVFFCFDLFKEIKIFNKNLLKILVSTLLMGVIVIYVRNLFIKELYNLIFSIFIGGLSYTLFLIILKEKILVKYLNNIILSIKRR